PSVIASNLRTFLVDFFDRHRRACSRDLRVTLHESTYTARTPLEHGGLRREIKSNAHGPRGRASSDRNACFQRGHASSDARTRTAFDPYRKHWPPSVAQSMQPVRLLTP